MVQMYPHECLGYFLYFPIVNTMAVNTYVCNTVIPLHLCCKVMM